MYRRLLVLASVILTLTSCGLTSSQSPQANPTAGRTVSGSNPTGGGSGGTVQHPKPVAQTFHGCPPAGDGGDPQLNILKNRIDTAPARSLSLQTILSRPWPQAINQRKRATWSSADLATVSRFEDQSVSVEAYLFGAKQEGPESPNCHDQMLRDYHVWIVPDPGADRTSAVVVEVTPRVHEMHPGWKLTTLRRLGQQMARVRITGWIMMDPEHPDQLQKTRGTLWEIHPITKIEVFTNGSYVNLDSLSSSRSGTSTP